MKPTGPRDSSGGSDETPNGVRTATAELDFAWPPSAQDLEGCGIVRLDQDGDDATSGPRAFVRLADVLAADDAPAVPRRRPSALPSAHAQRARHWGVERPDEAFPFRVDGDDDVVTTSAGETWRAALSLVAGLSLAFLSYAQFRGAHSHALATMVEVARQGPEPFMEPPAQGADSGGPLAAPDATSAPTEHTGVLAPVRAALAELAAEAPPVVSRVEALATSAIAETFDTRPRPESIPDAVVDAAQPQPGVAAALSLEDRAAPSAPAPVPAVHVDSVHAASVPGEPAPGEEAHIRAALTRWRAAYSALDASAARDVWPSVDARALERAFQALKSQELRFDRCDLTVNGGSAQAACSGQAVYVPRVGNQSPRATAREWTFELKKLDQRWTIASARAS